MSKIHTGTVPRYLGPRLERHGKVCNECIGIHFLAFRVLNKNEPAVVFIRALSRPNVHKNIYEHYAHELAAFSYPPHCTLECIGGGQMNIAGRDIDLYDQSSIYGSFQEFSKEVLRALDEAMDRGELERRVILNWPNYIPSRFNEIQRRLDARYPIHASLG